MEFRQNVFGPAVGTGDVGERLLSDGLEKAFVD